ncbi:MAG: bifunctional demethylmenaquinone methyltransferase/2-methoxy-6-polyprenyl-1,4-benzoquinol methylase UbiE [Alphaproteobacteria bacterium]|nr:bifunctional demethylmenaquinone methyltransferase/2-methoxy-6-polyprenyl-1,4-benzoquinol methylase UbiE [Alphaproteobacteria bacterium]
MVNAPRKTKAKEAHSASQNETTQAGFGFKPTAPEMRTKLVRDVFESVAPKYDVMNDIMSLGIHRLWKRDFVGQIEPLASDAILDLAGGTGDIAFLMEKARSKTIQPKNKITICDINPAMLDVGKQRAMDKGLHGKFNWVEGNAEELPFDDNSFDIVTIAFGLRNVTRLSKALADIRRTLKPGGRFYCLEFSHIPVPLLQKLYDRYSFNFLPWAGEKVAGDRAAYQYLAESIRAFPEQQALVKLMQDAGFSAVRYRNMSLGVAAVHSGFKA